MDMKPASSSSPSSPSPPSSLPSSTVPPPSSSSPPPPSPPPSSSSASSPSPPSPSACDDVYHRNDPDGHSNDANEQQSLLVPDVEIRTMAKPPFYNCFYWSRASQLQALLCVIVFVLLLVGIFAFHIHLRFFDMLQWLKLHQAQGAAIFIGFIAVFSVLLVPGSVFWLGAGFAFSPVFFGVGVAWVGSIFGMALTFGVSRFFFRKRMEQEIMERPEWAAADMVVNRSGWKMVFFLRLAMVPYNLSNYLFAITSISFLQFILPSSVGILPAVIIFCYFGSLVRDIHDFSTGKAGPSHKTTIAMAVISGVVIVLVVLFITYKARQYVNEELRKAQAEAPLPADLDDVEDGRTSGLKQA